MRLHWLSSELPPEPLKGARAARSARIAACVLFAISTALVAQTYPQGPYPQQAPGPDGPLAQQGPSPQGFPPQGPPQQGNNAPPDEPGRAVARLGIVNGEVSIRRGDSPDWEAGAVNAPLMSGDQISVGQGGRAEIQLDAAHFLRIAGDTELRLADLENGHYQVQISHGLITWRILRDTQSQAEISTPLVAVHPGRESVVRVEVGSDGATHVTVRHGDAEVSTEKGSETVKENTTMDVRGSEADPEFQVAAAAPRDEWDNWSDQRDSYLARAQAPRYVQQSVYGVEDLDAYGQWSYDPAYGWVWMPTVPASWAPYRDGQWVWEDYYGWTWVDYDPWGWAPFHYGNWYNRAGLGWAWYPGPRVGRIWWRPAMVGFFGWGGGVGVGVGFGFGNVGWVPLAPFEAFRPWYGRGGVTGFGGGIVRTDVAASFRNARVTNGVTAVTAADFQRGNFRNTLAVDRGMLQQASLVRGTVPVTPTSQNLRFSSRASAVQAPRGSMAGQRFFGSSTAGVQRTPFAQQQAAARSAVSGAESRFQSRPPQAGRTSQGQAGAPGWQRFDGSSQNSGANSRGAASEPGYNRFSSTPRTTTQPREYQVSPSIIRQRPETSTSSYGSRPPAESRPQQAPSGGRGAPAGGGRQSAGSHGGRH